MLITKNSKIYIAGHRGLVGSAITRLLNKEGYTNLILKTRHELDLLDQVAVGNLFKQEKPEYIFCAAAKVGGIMANKTQPAEFIYENLQVQNNIIHNAYLHGVKKLLFLGSSCIYPKLCSQPIKEECLLTSALEPTNEPYAIAKIAGIKTCQSYNRQYGTNFIAVMPTNLYGPNDNFDLTSSHVLPALTRKFHEAKIREDKEVTLWGTGNPMREFLHVDDMAHGCLFIMQNFNPTQAQNESGEMFMNLGSGADVTIKELAEIIKKTVGYAGKIIWDTTKPDGPPRKLLDVSKMNNLGWVASIGLEDGVKMTYEWFLGKGK
ncbi:MAG: GDP-L-fucose synthase [Candidatus Falkowbacteria bacterium]|nr:GDP-L-fucose synthase [Candidatus Falkowbacteria bacterium]